MEKEEEAGNTICMTKVVNGSKRGKKFYTSNPARTMQKESSRMRVR